MRDMRTTIKISGYKFIEGEREFQNVCRGEIGLNDATSGQAHSIQNSSDN